MVTQQDQNAPAPTEPWDYPDPHLIEVRVNADDIDVMGHTNNVVYLGWLEKIAWDHSCALGVNWALYERLNRAMVARRHELDYLAACHEGDTIRIATWITDPGKLGITRRYQLVRAQDSRTVMRAMTQWVCIRLDSGRPCRMPEEFVRAYQATA